MKEIDEFKKETKKTLKLKIEAIEYDSSKLISDLSIQKEFENRNKTRENKNIKNNS